MKTKKTYISLFSSAGVGCYAFKKMGFDCVATNELIERRLNVQKSNKKCKYESGYICGDITLNKTKEKLFSEIDLWKKNENIKNIDVVIATPPCQGMSVANHKKTSNEIVRNSLVLESINIVNRVKPKFFIFENVPAFMKTLCTDNDNKEKPIAEAIEINLGGKYCFKSQILNFKNYGSNSSRTRTLVIGVRKDLLEYVTPTELFPDYRKEKTLYQIIGDLPRLNDFYEISENDIYHFFRGYDPRMRCWIHDLLEGESAFDNENILNRPHQIIDGEIVPNVKKNGDKYTRQFWNRVAPCIHTRNDQLASQNTIHPTDDRVFSIRELMRMMSIPEDFSWSEIPYNILNTLSYKEKLLYLKKEEINIRQSIGEAVPTGVFLDIASKIASFLSKKNLNYKEISFEINDKKLYDNGNLKEYISKNLNLINLSSLSKIMELANAQRNEQSAFYTDKFLVEQIFENLPLFDKKTIRILEPSVGAGNFIPYLIKKYEDKKMILDVVDIDETAIDSLRLLLSKIKNKNVKINYICDDFIKHKFDTKYDLVIGNPPFTKLKKNSSDLKIYLNYDEVINKKSSNLASFFLEKACCLSENVAMIMPKNLLNTPEYIETREFLKQFNISDIIDFGEKGFKGVLVETIFLVINTFKKPENTKVFSVPKQKQLNQKQTYITNSDLPYWVIYRDLFFDYFIKNMDFDIFEVFRDRQITSSNTSESSKNGKVRVVKSRNISDDGSKLISIKGYDSYIDFELLEKLEVYKYLNNDTVYLTPNMTYKTRVMKKEAGYVVNGSVAILKLKEGYNLTNDDILFFSTNEYRDFMEIARNYQTRSLNIDSCSVYFFGKRKEV